jgi:hypothetical protein
MADAEHKGGAPKLPLVTQSAVDARHWHVQSSNTAVCIDRRELTLSSVAAFVLLLLIIASTVFYVAGLEMADETPWAMELCENARNFCQHPEWSAIPAALMALVYLSVKGMEL